jgi:mannose-6-phosphate isomerase
VKPAPTLIEPIFSPRIWGARSLAPLFPEKSNLTEPLGEAWLTGIDCKIASGPFAGKTLGTAWNEMPAKWRGDDFSKPCEFPLLVKFIFPAEKLSIQVHPDDAYASVHEKAAGGRGKTEMWHVVSAVPGARLLAGLKLGVTKEAFRQALNSKNLEDQLQQYEVHAGDTFYIPAGTPHTIGPGMIICEVQEYSDLTYRIYDYGRVDPSGNPRELHLEKALAVLNFASSPNFKTVPLAVDGKDTDFSLLAACKYFAVSRWVISSPLHWRFDAEGFRLFVVLTGRGKIAWKEGSSDLHSGECWLIPQNLKPFSMLPDEPITLLNIEVPYLPSLEEALGYNGGYSEAQISRTVFTED